MCGGVHGKKVKYLCRVTVEREQDCEEKLAREIPSD